MLQIKAAGEQTPTPIADFVSSSFSGFFEGSMVTTIVLVFVVAVLLSASVRIVPQQDVWVIELFGKYRRMLNPGLNFIIPFIEQVAHKQSMRVRQLQVGVETKTSDNVFVTARISVQYQVEDSDAVYNAFYQLEDPEAQIESYIFNSVRSQIPRQPLDEVFDNKDAISQGVKQELEDTIASYGFKIIESLVTDIDPDQSVKESMNAINAAERERRAAEHQAEAEKVIAVKKAEAEKESKILQGEGVAGQREKIAEGLKTSIALVKAEDGDLTSKDVIDLLKFTNYVDCLGSMDNANSKVIMMPLPNGQLDSIGQSIVAANEAK